MAKLNSNPWWLCKKFFSSRLTDIVHRDLKLENILVKSPNEGDNDRIHIKVRWCRRLKLYITLLLIHSPLTSLWWPFFPPISSIFSKGFKYDLIMTDSPWFSFIVHLYRDPTVSLNKLPAEHSMCCALTTSQPKQTPGVWAKTRLDHSINVLLCFSLCLSHIQKHSHTVHVVRDCCHGTP